MVDQAVQRSAAPLEGDRFFKVKDSEGRVFFTRRGQLQVDKEGFLTGPGGFRYLDEQDQEVRIGDSTSFKISPRGVITGKVQGELQMLGNLGVFRVADQARLRPVGRSMYVDTSGRLAIPDNPGSVRQGYLEQSNVEVMNELVRMIGIQRTFQSTAKALATVGRIKQTFFTAMQR